MSMVNKRIVRDDAASSPSHDAKRQKTNEEVPAAVGATELASAMALASLASFSPQSGRHDTAREARDADHAEEMSQTTWGSSLSWEARSPKEEAIPVTPESRFPVQPKRVHFAPGIKHVQREGIRRLNYPPRVGPVGSRLPPGFARGGSFTPRQVPPHWMRPYPHQHPLPPPHPHNDMHPYPQQHPLSPHHPHQHHQQRGPPMHHMMPPPGFMPPPPPRSMGQQPSPQNPNQWICDYCNVASFTTYEEACIHEDTCRHRMTTRPQAPVCYPATGPPSMSFQPPQPFPVPRPPTNSARSEQEDKRLPSDDREWSQGKVSLSIPDLDKEWLSELNCFIRAECVEAFSATAEDVSRTSKRGRISLHQVGIRCRFCTGRNMNERAAAALSYPTSVAGIYESVKRWQRVHLESCKDAPEEIKSKLTKLGNDSVWIPTTRQYWGDSAKALGMVDTVDGIRFGSDPSKGPDKSKLEASLKAHSPNASEGQDMDGEKLGDGDSMVYAEDIPMVPPYVYFLMRQVECCRFTEADRFVARSKGPVGYPGFQCRHCNGHAGLGKYFPVSSKSLSTNSTSQNIHAHLLKCRKCPVHLKAQLVALKEEKTKAPRLEPGWRKVFFDKIWVRLHGEEHS